MAAGTVVIGLPRPRTLIMRRTADSCNMFMIFGGSRTTFVRNVINELRDQLVNKGLYLSGYRVCNTVILLRDGESARLCMLIRTSQCGFPPALEHGK
jgi:hypothetical protein